MRAPGFVVYKCRMCAAFVKDVHSPDLLMTLICSALRLPNPFRGLGGEGPALYSAHDCGDGRHGLLDLIGGHNDNKETT